MPQYKIFAGLGGGFGGAFEVVIEEHNNLTNAIYSAYEYACNEYDSYGGMHGLFNEEDALAENPDLTEEELEEMRQEDLEAWVEYWAEEISEEE